MINCRFLRLKEGIDMQFTGQELNAFYMKQAILNICVLLIPVMLIVQVIHRKNRTPEISIFFRMCISNMVLCCAHLYICYYMVYFDETNRFFWDMLAYICSLTVKIVNLVIVVLWLLFVEYTLHKSMEIIHRRYPVVMIPFYVGVLFTVINAFGPLLIMIDVGFGFVLDILRRLAFLIWGFYIFASYVVLFSEKKRKIVPEYIVVTPTVICAVFGLIFYSATGYRVDSLGYALGLMFADYYMFRRLGYIDKKTGFYNEDYLKVISREAGKRKIFEATVVHFKAPEKTDKLAEILKFWKPEYSKIVIRKDGEFLVISETLKKRVSERFISLVNENCEKEGIVVESSYETVKRN